MAELDREGYAVLPAVAAEEEVAAARVDLERLLPGTPYGRDDFEGRATQRVYALFAKTRRLDDFATHPTVLAVLDQVLGHYQLSLDPPINLGVGWGG